MYFYLFRDAFRMWIRVHALFLKEILYMIVGTYTLLLHISTLYPYWLTDWKHKYDFTASWWYFNRIVVSADAIAANIWICFNGHWGCCWKCIWVVSQTLCDMHVCISFYLTLPRFKCQIGMIHWSECFVFNRPIQSGWSLHDFSV